MIELNYHAHLGLHLCFIFLFPSLSVLVALHLHLFQSNPTLPPPQSRSLALFSPCCLVKMTECEDMMEYFPSSLWISLCTDPGAHTHTNRLVSVSTHAERPMHHTKVSCVALTLMSLISVSCQWGVCHILHQSTAETIPRQETRRSEAACRCVQDKELKSWFHAYTITHSVYKPGWPWVVIVFQREEKM